jgi:DtxR family transcriptional regulator, Mn-dependent transcriptional regulator
MASVSIEDFLKNIYTLINLNGKATTGKLSERLGISNAAVTDMSRKLVHQNLIHYEKYRSLTLTAEGEKIAMAVIRRHRLWELFLNRMLEIPWERVHDEAEKLEHQTSEYLINEIDRFLDYPDFDPHGEPIPDGDGNIAVESFLRLEDIQLPAVVQLKSIVQHSDQVMAYLNHHALLINSHFEVLATDPDNKSLEIRIGENMHQMPALIASFLRVRIIKH